MGMYIFSKAIKQDEVMAAFGSKNQELIDKVKQSYSYDCYAEDDWDGEYILIDEALTDIIMGNEFKAGSAHIYGYAFICLCETMGKKVPWSQDFKLGYETDLVTQYLADDFGLEGMAVEENMFGEDLATCLPEREDFPMIGMISNKNLKALYDQLPEIELSDDELEKLYDEDDDKACAYENIKGLKDNLKFCMDNGMDLVSFCH